MKTLANVTAQFFEPIHHEVIGAKVYKDYEEVAKAFERLQRVINQSIYIIDYSKQNFLFVSSHPLFLCGYTAEEVQKMGYSFYEKVLSPEDLQMVLEINKFGWGLFYQTIPEERKNGCFSYDFFLHHKNGSKILVNHKLTPLFLTKSGNIGFAVCVVSLSSKKSAGNVVYSTNNISEYCTYDVVQNEIKPSLPPILSEREKEVFALMMRGFNYEEIAEKLNISKTTSRTHRQNILKKFNANNTTNAILTFNSLF